MSASGSTVLESAVSVTTATASLVRSSGASSTEGVMSTGSFSFFLFWMRFFFASAGDSRLTELQQPRRMMCTERACYATYLLAHICVGAPLLATVT